MMMLEILGEVYVPDVDPYSAANYANVAPGFYVASKSCSYSGSLVAISSDGVGILHKDWTKSLLSPRLKTFTASTTPNVGQREMVVTIEDLMRVFAVGQDAALARGLIS